MKKSEILLDVQEKIREVLGCDITITEDTLLSDIGDSIELTEVVWRLEDKYDVSIPMGVNRVGDVVKCCFPAATA